MGCVPSKDEKPQQQRKKSVSKKKKGGTNKKSKSRAAKNESTAAPAATLDEALVNFSALEQDVKSLDSSDMASALEEDRSTQQRRKKMRASERMETSGKKILSKSGNSSFNKSNKKDKDREGPPPDSTVSKEEGKNDSKQLQGFTVAVAGGTNLQRRMSLRPQPQESNLETKSAIASLPGETPPGLVPPLSSREEEEDKGPSSPSSLSRKDQLASPLENLVNRSSILSNRDLTSAQKAKIAEVASKRKALEARLMKGTVVGMPLNNPRVKPPLPRPATNTLGSGGGGKDKGKKGVIVAANTSRTPSSARSTVSSNIRSLGSDIFLEYQQAALDRNNDPAIAAGTSQPTAFGLFEVMDQDERAELMKEDCTTCECPSIDALLEFSTQTQRNQWIEWGMLIHTVNLGGFKRVWMNRWFANCGKDTLTHATIAAADDLSNVSTTNSSQCSSISSIGSIGSLDAPLPGGRRPPHNNQKSLTNTAASQGSIKTAENLNSALTIRNLQQNEKLINRLEARRTKKELQALKKRAGTNGQNPLLMGLMMNSSSGAFMDLHHEASNSSSSLGAGGSGLGSSGNSAHTFESDGSNFSDLLDLENERVVQEDIKRRDSQVVI